MSLDESQQSLVFGRQEPVIDTTRLPKPITASAALTSNVVAKFAEAFIQNPATISIEAAQRVTELLAIQLPVFCMNTPEDVVLQAQYILSILQPAQALQFLANAIATVAADYLDRMYAEAVEGSAYKSALYLPCHEARPGDIFFSLQECTRGVQYILGDLADPEIEHYLTAVPQ